MQYCCHRGTRPSYCFQTVSAQLLAQCFVFWRPQNTGRVIDPHPLSHISTQPPSATLSRRYRPVLMAQGLVVAGHCLRRPQNRARQCSAARLLCGGFNRTYHAGSPAYAWADVASAGRFTHQGKPLPRSTGFHLYCTTDLNLSGRDIVIVHTPASRQVRRSLAADTTHLIAA